MLAISQNTCSDKSVLNVLPCRIDHDGPAKVTKRYWTTRIEADGTKTSDFRGRRLRGRVVKVPRGYRGRVLKATEKAVVEPTLNMDEDEESNPITPVKIADEVSTFEEMVVWGHDQVPATDDSFVISVEEWTAFADAIHGQ